MRPPLLHRAQVFDREHLTREQHQPEARGVVRLEAAELHEQGEDRGRRVPDRELVLAAMNFASSFGFLPSSSEIEEKRRAVFDGDVDVEDRQVEVERRMAAEPVRARWDRTPTSTSPRSSRRSRG